MIPSGGRRVQRRMFKHVYKRGIRIRQTHERVQVARVDAIDDLAGMRHRTSLLHCRNQTMIMVVARGSERRTPDDDDDEEDIDDVRSPGGSGGALCGRAIRDAGA